MKIIVLDGYSANPGDLSWEPLRAFAELTVFDRTNDDEMLVRAKDADAVLTNKVAISDAQMAQLPNLKYIGVLATGYNIVDVAAARRRGIIVTNIPAYSTYSVVQMTFAHLLNIVNRVDHYATQNRAGRWSANPDFCYWDTPLHELTGMQMGVVGLGNIGMKVAQAAQVFGMKVLALTSKETNVLPVGIRKVDLPTLLNESDVITLHCPLTAETRELINQQTIAQMKDGAILINTGRGPLVNERDVAAALASGKLAAYGADVMCSEPPSSDNPLLSQPNAFLTPHVAWATYEARVRLMTIAIENVKAFVEGKAVNVVS